jgi:hypothetical protein
VTPPLDRLDSQSEAMVLAGAGRALLRVCLALACVAGGTTLPPRPRTSPPPALRPPIVVFSGGTAWNSLASALSHAGRDCAYILPVSDGLCVWVGGWVSGWVFTRACACVHVCVRAFAGARACGRALPLQKQRNDAPWGPRADSHPRDTRRARQMAGRPQKSGGCLVARPSAI